MQPLTRDRLAASAYRTLGLSASAGQAAIESAARRMRIWPDPARIPPTPWDLPTLGPISRTRRDIEHAVARLSEPSSRLEDRLVWYHGQRPPTHDNSGPSPSVADQHDGAVWALHAACAAGATGDLAPWRQALARYRELSASPEYEEWLARIEEEGQFDKRVSRAELEAAVRALPGAIVAALVPQARTALDGPDPAGLGPVLEILRENQASPQVADAIRQLIHGLEDLLDAHCRQMDAALRDKLRTNHSAPQPYYAANYHASDEAALFYSSTISPVLERLRMVADDPIVVVRANARVSEVVALLALGWEWSGKFVLAERSLELALQLADGPSAKETIEKDLARVRPRAEEERCAAQRASPPQTASPPPLPQVAPQPTARRTKTPLWHKRVPMPTSTGILIGILILAYKMLVWWAGPTDSPLPQPAFSPLPPGTGHQALVDAAAKVANETPPDPASLPRDVVDSVGEVNREP